MIVYFDFETRAGVNAPNLQRCGTYRYATEAVALVLAYAIDDGPVRVVATGKPLEWADLPELHPIFAEATFVAWNVGFDRCVWNYSLLDSPFMRPEQARDAMAVAMAANLPPNLERASTATGGPGKMKEGRRLIGKYCLADSPMPDLADPDWKLFKTYASIDVTQLRRLWKIMRPLPEEDWAVHAANARICDRGIPVDLDFVEHAARLAAIDTARTNARLDELTNGEITSVHQHERIADFAYQRLPWAEARAILFSHILDPEESDLPTEEEEEAEGEIVLSCKRPNVVQLLDFLRQKGDPDPVLREILELREYGAGASPKKFKAILEQNIGGRLYGQITFNGAGQTGRFSGKGVQPQNLTRNTLGEYPGDDYGAWEAPTVDLIADGCTWEDLAAYGLGEPVAKKLSLIVRPAVMAPIGRTIVKADYSQIEARVLPFLAGGTVDNMMLLRAFRESDRNPMAPDLYRLTASMMLHKPVEDVSSAERQTGKVAVLACGYGGGKGALISMGTAYGMYLSPEEAQKNVELWRNANQWAPRFWGKHNRDMSYGLMGAAMRAVAAPGTAQRAGRIIFTFAAHYLGGSLLMILPSGRVLTYPWCKVRDYEVKDKKTKKVIEHRHGLTFLRPGGLMSLYGGKFAENATQAAAADLLRNALVVCEDYGLEAVLHAHDEIAVECDEADAARQGALLRAIMEDSLHWTDGLPLAVETTTRFYYSAAKIRKGEVQHALQR